MIPGTPMVLLEASLFDHCILVFSVPSLIKRWLWEFDDFFFFGSFGASSLFSSCSVSPDDFFAGDAKRMRLKLSKRELDEDSEEIAN